MESLGILVRDLIRQFLAFAFPGATLILFGVHAVIGLDRFLPNLREYWLFFCFFGYGASVVVGFALHSMAIVIFHKKSREDKKCPLQWIGEREADFQLFAGQSVREHHRRLVAYWQMCIPIVLSSLLGAVLLIVAYFWRAPVVCIVASIEAAMLLASLVYGNHYMHVLVEAYEQRVIQMGQKGNAGGE